MIDPYGYRIYVDIMTGEKCSQFRLLTWISFIGQFVHPVGRKLATLSEYMIFWCKIQVIINPLINCEKLQVYKQVISFNG